MRTLILVATLSSLLAGAAGAADPPAVPWLEKADEAWRKARAERRPLLLFAPNYG